MLKQVQHIHISNRDGNHLMNDSNIDVNQGTFTNANGMTMDGIVSNQGRSSIVTPHLSHANIEYFNTPNYGAHPFAYSNNMGSVMNDNFYVDPLLEERRRRKSMIETFMVDRH